jgi:spore germination protein KB
MHSLLIGGIFLLLTSLTIILVLGINNASSLYFPGYSTVKRVTIGESLHRVEVISAAVYLLGGFIKISIYLLAACKGVAKLFECKDYRFIVIPISLLVVNLAYFEFDSVISFNEWIFNVWIYYAFPFMVIFPIIIFFAARWKEKRLMKQRK